MVSHKIERNNEYITVSFSVDWNSGGSRDQSRKEESDGNSRVYCYCSELFLEFSLTKSFPPSSLSQNWLPHSLLQRARPFSHEQRIPDSLLALGYHLCHRQFPTSCPLIRTYSPCSPRSSSFSCCCIYGRTTNTNA